MLYRIRDLWFCQSAHVLHFEATEAKLFCACVLIKLGIYIFHEERIHPIDFRGQHSKGQGQNEQIVK